MLHIKNNSWNFWSRSSNKDHIPLPSLNNYKTGQNESMGFSHWTTSSTGQWSLKPGKQKRWVLLLWQLFTGEGFQTAAQGRGTQTGTSSPAEKRIQSMKFRQRKVARIFSGKCRRGENLIERDLYISVEGILWVFGWVITYSCFWESYMRSQKEPWKRAGRFPRMGNSWRSH